MAEAILLASGARYAPAAGKLRVYHQRASSGFWTAILLATRAGSF